MFRNQVFAEREGTKLMADVYLPSGDGPFPAVLMIHGGAWASGSRSNMAAHALYLANHGYAVAAISYRLAPMHRFPAQLEDCQEALDWLVEHSQEFEIDTARIAGWGHSAGGHLACLVAAMQSAGTPSHPLLKAVVAGAAPCDFTNEPLLSHRLAFFLGGSRAEAPGTYEKASPVAHVTAKCPPIFFFHGTEDNVVPIGQAQVMHEKLTDLGIPSVFYQSQGRGHFGCLIDQDARQEALKFLDQQLKLEGS
ncbi:alpha/beta hydrolase [Blastopirellula marina]|uniref:Alpha/beta hydrolase n=1 Tax=Blastopirellula marina TaxID=124 RepID=A0A2S8GC60_9BACT|nr:alpha/beta hydrolase [Blastopirellula marina]PQO42048.1 alpha/beta hydrolase [Blastopirellula marina]